LKTATKPSGILPDGFCFLKRACAKFSVNTEEMWYNVMGREHRKEEKNGKTKEIPVDE
jgi:hypothetical protein